MKLIGATCHCRRDPSPSQQLVSMQTSLGVDAWRSKRSVGKWPSFSILTTSPGNKK